MTLHPLAFLSCLSIALFSSTGCSSSKSGTNLVITAAHRTSSGTPQLGGGSRTFTNDLGTRITLSRAYLAYQVVEIVACTGSDPSSGNLRLRRAAYELWSLLAPIGVAYAHTDGTPTRLGEPSVDHLLDPDGQRLILGELSPPLASYCHALVTLGPADDDAANLPADADMVGLTVHLEGSYQVAGSDAIVPFTRSLGSTATQTVDFRLGGVLSSPLVPITLTDKARDAELDLTSSYDTWLQGIDLGAPFDAAQQARLMSNLAASITQVSTSSMF